MARLLGQRCHGGAIRQCVYRVVDSHPLSRPFLPLNWRYIASFPVVLIYEQVCIHSSSRSEEDYQAAHNLLHSTIAGHILEHMYYVLEKASISEYYHSRDTLAPLSAA